MADQAPKDCVECSTRQVLCDQKEGTCTTCKQNGRKCSYDWTMGPQLTQMFGTKADISCRLRPINVTQHRSIGIHGECYKTSYKYIHPKYGEMPIAVKVIKAEGLHPTRVLQHTLRHAWMWSKIEHDNIAYFIGLADLSKLASGVGPQLAVVTPWSRGSLAEYLEDLPMPEHDPLGLIWDVAAGLDYLHTLSPCPVVHGGLTPNNLLMFKRDEVYGGRLRACITDFGHARTWKENQLTPLPTTTSPWESPKLLAWERIEPAKYGFMHEFLSITMASDVFEMARLAFQIITGKPAFHRLTDRQVLVQKVPNSQNPDCPSSGLLSEHEGLWNLLQWCWSAEPSARPTAGDVKTLIEWYRLISHVLESSDYLRNKTTDIPPPLLPPELELKTLPNRVLALLGKSAPSDTRIPDWALGDKRRLSIAHAWYPLNAHREDITPEVLRSLLDILPTSSWQELSIKVGSFDQMRKFVECCTASAGALRHLCLNVDYWGLSENPKGSWTNKLPARFRQPQALFVGAYPNLESLSLHIVTLPWPSLTLSKLRTLDLRHHPTPLRPTTQEFTTLLQNLPQLTDLTLVNSGPKLDTSIANNMTAQTMHIVTMPKLEMLRIGVVESSTLAYLLTTIDAPNLRRLYLHGLRIPDNTSATQLLAQHRFPLLARVKIYDVSIKKAAFFVLLSSFPTITWLEVWARDPYLRWIVQADRQLSVPVPPVLPALRYIIAVKYEDTTVGQFLDERRRLRHPVEALSVCYHEPERGCPDCGRIMWKSDAAVRELTLDMPFVFLFGEEHGEAPESGSESEEEEGSDDESDDCEESEA